MYVDLPICARFTLILLRIVGNFIKDGGQRLARAQRRSLDGEGGVAFAENWLDCNEGQNSVQNLRPGVGGLGLGLHGNRG